MVFIKELLILIILMGIQSRVCIFGVELLPGVCYGRKGDNLPPPSQVVAMYKRYGIRSMRLFDPDIDALTALKGQQIQVTLGVTNQDLQNLVAIDAAKSWFSRYVTSFPDVSVAFIAIGNEAIPWEFSPYIEPVMQNFQTIIAGSNMTGIGVTTSVSMKVMKVAFPPSAGAFKDESDVMSRVVKFLARHDYPLMVNAYTYWPYTRETEHVPLPFAQFTAKAPVVHDINSGLDYWNLLDAMADAVYSAMEKVGVSNVSIAFSETGWPSAGNGNFTTIELARTYNENVMKRFNSGKGTPKKPSRPIVGYIFAMFNENLKPDGVEQNWGLFYPDGRPVYDMFSENDSPEMHPKCRSSGAFLFPCFNLLLVLLIIWIMIYS